MENYSAVEKYVDSMSRKYARFNDMDVDDLRQEAWVEVLTYANKPTLGVGARVMSARQGIIRAIRYHKTDKRSTERDAYRVNADGTDYQIEDDYSGGDAVFRVWLHRYLARFSRFEVNCFILCEIAGYVPSELSEKTGISIDKIKRARVKVRNALQEVLQNG